MLERIEEARQMIVSRYQGPTPEIGIVFGTGLGFDKTSELTPIPYNEIPHFPVSTVEGHAGKLLLGIIENKPVAVLSGRFHYYEGYTMAEITFPIRVLKEMGIKTILFTNIAGSTNPIYRTGDLILVKDHINLLPENPLRGLNESSLGLRFPDMSRVYDEELIELASGLVSEMGFKIQTGVYVSLQGPNLETPAEYEFIHRIGGDLVGMSTVPEVIVARHGQIRVLLISMVSNVCYPREAIRETKIEDVLVAVSEAKPRLHKLIGAIVREM